MRLPGTTPAAPDDDGRVDPALEAVLGSGDSRAVGVVLLQARVLVPVVAEKSTGESDMSLPALVNAAGRRALPIFSSYDALRAWRPDARPVPMSGSRVMAGAQAEGYDGVVLDVAGPVTHTYADSDFAALAAAAAELQRNPTARLAFPT